MAEIVSLQESSPEEVQLGNSCISFKLAFTDVFLNPTNMFKNNKNTVKVICSSEHLVIKGLKDSYKPGKDGILKGKITLVQEYSLFRDISTFIFQSLPL